MPQTTRRASLTPFGRTVMVMAIQRGYTNQSALTRALNELPPEVSPARFTRRSVNNWLTGTHPVPRDFIAALKALFGLQRGEERFKLLAVALLESVLEPADEEKARPSRGVG